MLPGSIADLVMSGQIREYLQQTTAGHQSYPAIVPPRTGSKVCCVIVGWGRKSEWAGKRLYMCVRVLALLRYVYVGSYLCFSTWRLCHMCVYWSVLCMAVYYTWVRTEEELKRPSAQRKMEPRRKTPGSWGRTNTPGGGTRKKRERRGRMRRGIKHTHTEREKESERERQSSCCRSHVESRKKAGEERVPVYTLVWHHWDWAAWK